MEKSAVERLAERELARQDRAERERRKQEKEDKRSNGSWEDSHMPQLGPEYD